MERKQKLAYGLGCVALAFVGVFHIVFSTAFDYGLRWVGGVLIAAAVFGLFVISA